MELKYVPVSQLSPNPVQPRQTITQEKILNLADSLRKHQMLVPLLVAKTPAGFQLIAGERRLRAAKLAGWREVPCVILTDLAPADFAFLSLAENLQNEPLNLLEQAAVLQSLQSEYGFSSHRIATELGLTEERVETVLKVLRLPDQIKSSYLDGEINEEILLRLADIEDPLEILDEFNSWREQLAQSDLAANT